MSAQNSLVKKVKLLEQLKSSQETTLKTSLQEMNISRRTFFRYLDELRDAGAEIVYSKRIDRYVLKKDFNYLESILKESL